MKVNELIEFKTKLVNDVKIKKLLFLLLNVPKVFKRKLAQDLLYETVSS